MIDFEFKRPSRRCAETDRELEPGERFVSALVEQKDGSLTRLDYAQSVWKAPPEDCVGWWIGQVPIADKNRVYWAPNHVLLAYFEHQLAQPDSQSLVYVMALVLIRKRIVQWRETKTRDGRNWMSLFDPRNRKDYEVAECELDSSRIVSIQNELAEKLFADQAEDTHDNSNADSEVDHDSQES